MSELDVTFEANLEQNTGRRRGIATREEATDRVAAALSKAPGVEDTAAVVDTTGTNAIVGAVVPASADAAKVMSLASRCLPGLPRAQGRRRRRPHPQDGGRKVRRAGAARAVEAAKGEPRERRRAADADRNRVAEAWAETLACDARTVSLDDDFFQVGGSSIVAGQLASDIRRKLGGNLTGADIFRYRTVAQIAVQDREGGRAEQGGGARGGSGGAPGGLPPSMASKPLGSMAWTYHFSPTSVPSLITQSLPSWCLRRCRRSFAGPSS